MSMQIGTKMHTEFSLPYKSWERRLLLYKLNQLRPFTRTLDGIHITGVPDDYETDGKNVSLIEVFTTDDTNVNVDHKILQLQKYLWLIEPYLNGLDYYLTESHWLLIFEQSTKLMFDKILVLKNPDVEDIIRSDFGKAKDGKLRVSSSYKNPRY